jgi:hypothetical protein
MKEGLMVGTMMAPKDVAAMYGVTTQELAQWRRANLGPPYFTLGRNTVRYDSGDIEDWFNDPVNGYLHDYPAGR